jgi:heterotetrameric sarcosine oxidase delta subunit
MRISCPYCGDRDRREFTYFGDEKYLRRPAADAPAAAWDDYLHLRDNLAGDVKDLWYHDPCGTWARVTRNTVTHAIASSEAIALRKDRP